MTAKTQMTLGTAQSSLKQMWICTESPLTSYLIKQCRPSAHITSTTLQLTTTWNTECKTRISSLNKAEHWWWTSTFVTLISFRMSRKYDSTVKMFVQARRPLRFSRFIRQATCKQVRESPPDGNSPTLSEKNLHKRNWRYRISIN